jgi:branched-chain amino acid aminotransferase
MIDGQLRPAGEQSVSVFDRGFLYGDSVFETIRTYGGIPFELDEHMGRLEQSARLVFISLPVPISTFAAEVLEAVGAAANPESYVRVMLTRGQGALGLDPTLCDRPLRVTIVQPLSIPPAHHYVNGVAAISYRTQRQIDGTSAEGAKIGNYLVSVLAMREAGQVGALEALLVDVQGRVSEGASSNVFVVKAGQLITAPVGAGILAGITRAHVLDLAEALGIGVQLRAPHLDEVYAADEVFISSSIRELMPVVRLDQRSLGSGSPGPVFRQLLAAFRQRVGHAAG